MSIAGRGGLYAEQTNRTVPSPNNLGLYRLTRFGGRRTQLLTLHDWMTGGDDLPAICISGEQGIGKSSLATAAAWNHIHHFKDGIIRVAAAGGNRLRLYDIVRTMDTVFGTTLSRLSEERWGINILEQLYRRSRLLIVDDLSGVDSEDLHTLVDIISHLHEVGGNSRIILIDRNFHSSIEALVQKQFLSLQGLERGELDYFIDQNASDRVKTTAHQHGDELYAISSGHPFMLRLILGILLDYSWSEVKVLIQDVSELEKATRADPNRYHHESSKLLDVTAGVEQRGLLDRSEVFVKCAILVTVVVEHISILHPGAGPFLIRLTSAAGGATLNAVRNLFWSDLGSGQEYRDTVEALLVRGLIDIDRYGQRLVMHPIVRRYLSQNITMLGEEWERNHASYYVDVARQYQRIPLERWPEVDIEWGNITSAADWAVARIHRLWQENPLDILNDESVEADELLQTFGSGNIREDLQLARDYALSLAHYAFWRHPPNTLTWVAAGAVASLALYDSRNYGWLLLSMGRQEFFRNQVASGLVWMNRARKIFESNDLLEELIYAHTDIGTSMRILNEPRAALEHFTAAFETISELGIPKSLPTAYMNIGSAHYSLGNFEQAIHKHRRALIVAHRHNNRHAIASAFNNLGLAAEGLERYDIAQQAYQQALSEFRLLDDLAGISICCNNLGALSYHRQRLSEALKWYEHELRICETTGAWTEMASTLHNLGHVSLDEGNLRHARRYFQQSKDLYAAFDLEEYVLEEEEMLAYIDAHTDTDLPTQTKR